MIIYIFGTVLKSHFYQNLLISLTNSFSRFTLAKAKASPRKTICEQHYLNFVDKSRFGNSPCLETVLKLAF